MDSFTQIALGAAVGEVVLGKKVGNRAMVWGAVGGTIPDLDIVANFFTDELTALAFHRGISHSFFFATTFPIVLGWLVHRLYQSNLYKTKGYKLTVFTGAMLFYGIVATVISAIPVITGGEIYYPPIIGSLVIGAGLAYWLWKNYYKSELTEVNASWKDWSWLLFWAIFTHPLLDCCTAYGTQVFQPFSDYRVAFNNVSVVDPIYTLPLLIGLVLAARVLRHHPRRRWFNGLGLALSTAYLVFTFYNKTKINQIFENTLAEQEITYNRYLTAPTILNNVLWNCLAEGDTAFYYGLYSRLDEEPKVKNIKVIPKGHALVKDYRSTEAIQTLSWFSNDYYNVIVNKDGVLQLNDLRFGIFENEDTGKDDYIFKFLLEEKNGHLEVRQTRESDKSVSTRLGELIERVKGI